MSKERTCLSVQDCIQHAIHRWDLTNVQTVYQTTAKAVLTADSGTYGPVIVKVDMNRSQLKSEYNMLKRLSGEHNCKVFAFDEPSGILMEEQIIPGTTLRKESSFVERIEAFHSIFYGIHRPVNAECAEAFETYLTWLEKIVDFCQNHSIEKTISDWAVLAQEYGIELFDKYQDRFLLHGDFHHDNILLRSDGT